MKCCAELRCDVLKCEKEELSGSVDGNQAWGVMKRIGFFKTAVFFVLLAVAQLAATVAFARTDEDLASISVDGEWLGMAGDKLGGMFLEDVMDVYWDTPTSGGNNTDRGPVSSPAVTSCDFDGDGYPDLAIGAPDGDKVYLFYGNPASLVPGLLDLSTASNYDVAFTGRDGSAFGIELGSGDVNGDGYCDLLVGAPYISAFGNTGEVYLLLGDDRGGSSGLFPAGPGDGVDASANYSLRVVGKSEYSILPTDSVAFSVAVGDLSGDGLADFVVGAFFMDRTSPTNEQDAGAVAVYFGKTTVTHANTSGINLDMGTQTVGGVSFDGYNVRYFGQEGYPSGAGAYNGETDNLGSSVACVDLNGDGVDDLAMGAPCPELNYSASGTNDTGSVYVIFGGGAADGTGTANLGTGPVILGDTGTYHIRFNAVQDWAHLGAAMAGGDLTGDGVDDLVVAAPYGWYNFTEGDESGSIYLIAGDTAWRFRARDNSNIDLIAPGNGYNIRIDGAALGDELRSVAVGDVDGDGQADLLLGAPKAEDSGRTDCGATYEFYGPMVGTYASDLGSPGGHDRRTLGAVAGDRLGTAVAFVDYPCGFVRRVLSAPYASSNAGQVYLMASDWSDTSCGGFCISHGDCDDGDPCNGVETCRGGSCVGGAAPDCSGTGDFCRADSTCDSSGAEGNCDTFGAALNEGVACDDGDVCNVGETCQSGSCVGGGAQDCSGTGSFCRADLTCDSGGTEGNCDTFGGGLNEGVACDDGNVCNVGETCQSGSCAGGGAQDCSGTGAFCRADSICDSGGPEGNCDTFGAALNEGVACDDGDVCNVGETCQSGSCTGSSPMDCSGTGSFCQADSTCDSGGAEGNCDALGAGINDGLVCEDGDLCSLDDRCQAGSCVSGAPVVCTASDQCHVAGVCNSGTGLCSDPSTVDDTPCNDGVACTFDDVCTGGVCAGAPLAQEDVTCDGFDDDCDGGTDEDYVSVDSCGQGYCQAHSIPSTCVAGVETACQPGDPLSNDDTTCDTVDDDCDGTADEDYPSDDSCGLGYCQVHNMPSSCVAGVETACEPGDPLGAVDASCDAVDDDCDGLADEDYASDASCGVGYCQDHNLPSTCVAGVETICQPGAPLSADDSTCDSVDDDCDGLLDEDSDCFDPNVYISLGENSPEGGELVSGFTLPVFQVRIETRSASVNMNRLRLRLDGLEALLMSDHNLVARLFDDPDGDGQVELDGEPLGESVVVDAASSEIVFEELGLSMAASASRIFVLTLSLNRQPTSGCGCASAGAGSALPMGFVLLGLLLLAPGRRRRVRCHGHSLVALALIVALIALGGLACGRYGFEQVAQGQVVLESNQDLQVHSAQWSNVSVQGAPLEGQAFLVRID